MGPGVPGTTGTPMLIAVECARKSAFPGQKRFAKEELLTEAASLDLVPEAVDDFRLRADEEQSGRLNFLRELGVLGEEAVSGVNHRYAVLESNLRKKTCESYSHVARREESRTLMMSSCARYAATGVRPLPTWYASSAYEPLG